jgi:hypothetical protein
VVYRAGGTTTSNGFNVVDVSLGVENSQSGFTSSTGDLGGISTMPVTRSYLGVFNDNNTVRGRITTRPSGYPEVDFYGTAIPTANATPGAVQNSSRVVVVNNFADDSNSPNTPGTLRHAIMNLRDGDLIRFLGVIPGTSVIEVWANFGGINNIIDIEGNGITITIAGGGLPPYSVLTLNRNVSISRVHFKDIVNVGSYIQAGAITLSGISIIESCIFSGNQLNSNPRNSSGTGAGAIGASGDIVTIRGCTFYGNSSASIGAISTYSGTNFTGNLFFGNTSRKTSYYHSFSSFSSHGYNVIDVSSYWATLLPTDKILTTPC